MKKKKLTTFLRKFYLRFFIKLFLKFCQIDFIPLNGIMKFLGHAEKVGTTLDHAPAGLDSDRVHEQGQRAQQFSHTTAIIRRIHVCDMQRTQRVGFFLDALDNVRINKFFIIIDVNQIVISHNPHRSSK